MAHLNLDRISYKPQMFSRVNMDIWCNIEKQFRITKPSDFLELEKKNGYWWIANVYTEDYSVGCWYRPWKKEDLENNLEREEQALILAQDEHFPLTICVCFLLFRKTFDDVRTDIKLEWTLPTKYYSFSPFTILSPWMSVQSRFGS